MKKKTTDELVLEFERLNTALETAGNSLAEVRAQMEFERQGKETAETRALNLQKELDTLRRSTAELERRLKD
jgi:DNA-binding transcriptional MerR regulator